MGEQPLDVSFREAAQPPGDPLAVVGKLATVWPRVAGIGPLMRALGCGADYPPRQQHIPDTGGLGGTSCSAIAISSLSTTPVSPAPQRVADLPSIRFASASIGGRSTGENGECST